MRALAVQLLKLPVHRSLSLRTVSCGDTSLKGSLALEKSHKDLAVNVLIHGRHSNLGTAGFRLALFPWRPSFPRPCLESVLEPKHGTVWALKGTPGDLRRTTTWLDSQPHPPAPALRASLEMPKGRALSSSQVQHW